ncbi:hypothetical protein HK096_011220, partial [Nowakowskiella sp. JEL0078]
QVRNLDELEENGNYVASSGEGFKRVPYPILVGIPEQLLHQFPDGISDRAERILAEQKKRIGGRIIQKKFREYETTEKEIPIFSSTTKAFRVIVYPNGENDKGRSLILNYRNCKNFDQLLKGLTELLQMKGFIRKLYDGEDGQRIRKLQDLRDGQSIVCVGQEQLVKMKYQAVKTILASEKKQEKFDEIHIMVDGQQQYERVASRI